MMGSASVFATWRSASQIGLNVLLHRESRVRVTDALAERLPAEPAGALTPFYQAHLRTRNLPKRWGMWCVFTTLFGSRPGASFRCAAWMASSAVGLTEFPGLDGVGPWLDHLRRVCSKAARCHNHLADTAAPGRPVRAAAREQRSAGLLLRFGLDAPPRAFPHPARLGRTGNGVWYRGCSDQGASSAGPGPADGRRVGLLV